MILPKHTRHIRPAKLLALATLILTVTLSVAPHTVNATTTNQYKAILGEEGALVSLGPIPPIPPLPLPRETIWFWAWRTALNSMLNELQLEGKYVSKFDVLYEISNHPDYDPDWLKSEVISAINSTPANSNLIMFGHMGPDNYVPYRFLWAYLATSFNPIPLEWAVPGDVIVYTSDVNLVTLSKPVSELPGLIVLIGCSSLPDDAVESNSTWAHTFKLSKWFYPYTIYWNQRGIQGFNNTIKYTDTQILEFIDKALEYATYLPMGIALSRAGQDTGVNVVLEYYTGRYTYVVDYLDFAGSVTAVFVGDYNLSIDPTLDNEAAEKVIGYIKMKYPLVYLYLANISDGLIYSRSRETLLHLPGFGSVIELKMKFKKNMSTIGVEIVTWLDAYLWNDNIIKFDITSVVKTRDNNGARWAREIGEEVLSLINETVIPALERSGLNVSIVDQSKPPREQLLGDTED